MKLAKMEMKKKSYTLSNNKGAMGFIFTEGQFEIIEKILMKNNIQSVKAWNSTIKFIKLMENMSMPLSEEEKELQLRVTKDGSPKNHCFKYGDFVEIWRNTFMYGGPAFVGSGFSKGTNQLIVGLEMKVSRSRIKNITKPLLFFYMLQTAEKH